MCFPVNFALIFKKTFSTEHLQTTASVFLKQNFDQRTEIFLFESRFNHANQNNDFTYF